MADVVAAVRQELVKDVGRPVISVQPATAGLIGLPILFSAPPQHTTTLTITQPLPGAITAVPAYSWDLGDGQSGTGPGHRYSQPMDPTDPSTNGYYVEGTYTQTGRHPVRLTLTWQASIHLGPAVGGLDVDLDPITFTTTATATTVSANNHLYADVPR